MSEKESKEQWRKVLSSSARPGKVPFSEETLKTLATLKQARTPSGKPTIRVR